MNLMDFLADFDERLENVSVFYPIFRLQGAQKYPNYDILTLGFSLLVYILDTMLKGREGCDSKELALFLKELVNFNYGETLSEEEAGELTYYVLDILRNGGRPYEIIYRNPYKRIDRKIKVVLIEIASYMPNEPVKYRLSTQGLDLMFKTREIYKELRITISQIYLKQQIEKGVFHEAIRTVDDLSLQVRDLKDRIRLFMERVFKNVLDVGIEGYINLYDEAYEQIEKEHQVFNDIKNLLNNLYQSLQSIDPLQITTKERNDLEYVISLSKKLDNVINEHGELLKKRIDLGQKYFEAMENQFASGFKTKIDFEREIVDEIVKGNAGYKKVIGILSPIFSLKQHKFFNIHKIFEEQHIDDSAEEEDESSLIDLDEAAVSAADREKELIKVKRENYRYYAEILLSYLKEKTEGRLSEILQGLTPQDYYKVINSFDFFSFLIILHQMKFVDFKGADYNERNINYGEEKGIDLRDIIYRTRDRFEGLEDIDTLEVRGSDEVINLENGFQVTDYIFRIK
jgi:hypothetical protein